MKKAIIIILSLIIVTFGINIYFHFEKNVITESEAIKIATNHIKNIYGEKFSEYDIKVYDEDELWIISYSPPKSDDFYALGGGGPLIEIKKNGGKVLSCLLQK